MKYSSVLIVEDHPMVGGALAGLVEGIAPDVTICLVESAEAGLMKAHFLNDLRVILLDFNLPKLSGIESVRAFTQRHPNARLVVISGTDDRHTASAALRAGASSFITKAVAMDVISNVIRQALNGATLEPKWITPSARITPDSGESDLFTERQREVLALMIKGLSNKEIGLLMNLAEVTVKMHASAIFRILKVVNRTQAVTVARHLWLDRLSNDKML